MNNIPSKEEFGVWLTDKVSEYLGIERTRISPEKEFTIYGLDSATAVSIAGEMEDWIGRELNPEQMWEFPSINLLSSYLADNAGSFPVIEEE